MWWHKLGEPQFGVLQLPQELKEQVCKPLKTHMEWRTQRVCISELATKKSPSSSITWIYIYITSGLFGWDKIKESMQWKIISLLLLIAWPNGALWMVGILLHACTCVKSNLVAAFLNSVIYLLCTSTTDLHGSWMAHPLYARPGSLVHIFGGQKPSSSHARSCAPSFLRILKQVLKSIGSSKIIWLFNTRIVFT
jgi:hypothetical protein